MTQKIKGELEIDHERGVIYFHAMKKGIAPTPLRICRLGKLPKFTGNTTLDLTHMHGYILEK